MERQNRSKRKNATKSYYWIFYLVPIVIVLTFLIVFICISNSKSRNIDPKLAEQYPIRFEEYVKKYSKEFGVDEILIYTVIRTESAFDADAGSGAGARGLMQIMPSTFEWLQNQLDGEVTMGEDALYDPATNIKYGTYLLKFLLDRYKSERTALIAYNAGFSQVDEWLKDRRLSSDGVEIENIPIEETREYIKKVYEIKDIYKKLYF